jgi:hypothetical protein
MPHPPTPFYWSGPDGNTVVGAMLYAFSTLYVALFPYIVAGALSLMQKTAMIANPANNPDPSNP